MSLPGYQSPFERTPGLRRSLPAFDRISVVVPFYNEEECAEFVLREIVTCHPGAEVIAIDDGSKDRTWEILCSVPGVTPLRPVPYTPLTLPTNSHVLNSVVPLSFTKTNN